MSPARRAALRRLARTTAFESGFAGDFPLEAGMARCLLYAESQKECAYLLARYVEYHATNARRADAARHRRTERTSP